VLLFLLLVGAVLQGVYYGAATMEYDWQWYSLPRFFVRRVDGGLVPGVLVQGLLWTIGISAAGLVCALVIGLVTALMRLSSSWVASRLARLYVEAIRNTPMLTQIYLLYFVAAPVAGVALSRAFGTSVQIPALLVAIAALSLFEAAYISEIIRGGIVSISGGQWEAAHSLGMSRWQTYRHVVLPQTLRRVLPPLTGQSVALVKDSSLLSAIGIYELTKHADTVVSNTWMIFEVWVPVAALYLVLTLSLSGLSHWLERRMQVTPGGATA
jgi:polar amino acid transport system permease protein